MPTIAPEILHDLTDVLRLRNGQSLTVRFVEPADIGPLSDYFHALSRRSNYNRFLGAMHDLPEREIVTILATGEANRFAVIGEVDVDGTPRIVAEARYAYHLEDDSAEFGLSVADGWQGLGVGSALLKNLECRTAALGATRLVGDTLRNNDEMKGLARKLGYAFAHSPYGWELVRVQKPIYAAEDIPCVNWREIAPSLDMAAG
jgi:RimJ/RimL family protein N-acetyltransferase